jgi:hypothetical protein
MNLRWTLMALLLVAGCATPKPPTPHYIKNGADWLAEDEAAGLIERVPVTNWTYRAKEAQ